MGMVFLRRGFVYVHLWRKINMYLTQKQYMAKNTSSIPFQWWVKSWHVNINISIKYQMIKMPLSSIFPSPNVGRLRLDLILNLVHETYCSHHHHFTAWKVPALPNASSSPEVPTHRWQWRRMMRRASQQHAGWRHYVTSTTSHDVI